MLNIWGNPLERCNDWVHYSVFSLHTVIVFSITKLTWQLLAGRYCQDANLIFTRCLDLKHALKMIMTVWQIFRIPRFGWILEEKHLPMTWMLMAHHDWKITATRIWRSWLLQANEQNYLLIELNLREDGWNGWKQQSGRGRWIWRRHKNDGDGEDEYVEEGLVGPTYWWSKTPLQYVYTFTVV